VTVTAGRLQQWQTMQQLQQAESDVEISEAVIVVVAAAF
jgi:hypothetical protein